LFPPPPPHSLSDVLFHERELKRGVGTRFKPEPLPSPGDEMRLLVRHIQNPMGELELSNAEREKAEREDGVWREILDRYRRGRPVTGRILNPVNGGYAVGVAGLVCFLPNATARGSRDGGSAPPAGELMSFKIINITEAIRNVILAGPVDGEYASRGGGRGGRPAWASAPRGNARGKGGKDASSLAEGAAGERGGFWRKRARERKERGESVWTKLDGREREKGREVPRVESAPMEKVAGDGRPMWKAEAEAESESESESKGESSKGE